MRKKAVVILLMIVLVVLTVVVVYSNPENKDDEVGNHANSSLKSQYAYWAKSYGGGDEDYARSIFPVSDGYIVAGYTQSFGASSYDGWVIKLNESGDLEWQKMYSGNNNDLIYSISETNDGGYVMVGYTTSASGDENVWVVKLNSSGGIEWQRSYGGSGYDIAFDVMQTNDGGYIVVGKTESFGVGKSDMWILKLNSTGNITWQKAYGGSENEYAYDIDETND